MAGIEIKILNRIFKGSIKPKYLDKKESYNQRKFNQDMIRTQRFDKATQLH